jgi:hypothetical protein
MVINFLDTISHPNFCLKWFCGHWGLSLSSGENLAMLGPVDFTRDPYLKLCQLGLIEQALTEMDFSLRKIVSEKN